MLKMPILQSMGILLLFFSTQIVPLLSVAQKVLSPYLMMLSALALLINFTTNLIIASTVANYSTIFYQRSVAVHTANRLCASRSMILQCFILSII
jgi:hypothetical protein